MKYNTKHTLRQSGFTLIELMVAISIIVILSLIVMASLNSGKDKGNDSKVQSHLKSMINQAQLYVGPANAQAASTTAITTGDGGGTGNLFNSNITTNNGLYRLIVGLPTGTIIYYASEATAPVAGGKWAIAASTSKGSYCVDYTTALKSNTAGTSMTAANASTQWTSLAGSYVC
ncbi:MAG: prepilin-type N-terminal cleavage/methylation domain-containing protein [Patescibacteria group bacterium]